MTKEEILDALKAVKYPPYSKDIVSFGMVKYVKIDGKKAEIKIFTGGAEDTAKKVVSDSAHELSKKFPDCIQCVAARGGSFQEAARPRGELP